MKRRYAAASRVHVDPVFASRRSAREVAFTRRGVSVRSAPREHGRQRLGEDRDVEPDRPVLEVVEVETDEVVEAEVDAPRHLPEAGHAGQDEVALAMPVVELDVVAERERPRTD